MICPLFFYCHDKVQVVFDVTVKLFCEYSQSDLTMKVFSFECFVLAIQYAKRYVTTCLNSSSN